MRSIPFLTVNKLGENELYSWRVNSQFFPNLHPASFIRIASMIPGILLYYNLTTALVYMGGFVSSSAYTIILNPSTRFFGYSSGFSILTWNANEKFLVGIPATKTVFGSSADLEVFIPNVTTSVYVTTGIALFANHVYTSFNPYGSVPSVVRVFSCYFIILS